MEKVVEMKGPPSEEAARPMSKKELRAQKKAAKKTSVAKPAAPLTKEELHVQKKMRRKEFIKEKEIEEMKEIRKEKKILKQKRLNREMNAPGGVPEALRKKKQKIAEKTRKMEKAKSSQNQESDQNDMTILDRVFNGSVDEETGTSTLRMGVKCIDVTEGTGTAAQDGMLATVRYKLTGKSFTGVFIDSSKSFNFRLGKGEVIQGWDIGVLGMQVGGRRKIIVPPKAGYGAKDIGAGCGATLCFDITLLACR
mmetsp:Transcript_3539/g.6468  ORF Transcript_3539/g.6468 Transcript_3539/m.6468 type:complete len:252 (-) Transcript_3539:49-804(-)|eukprot:CAMPEP_0201886528 /NCGR_PEP_ID=MMETSP0902-20130614/22321_1 /ASSEMBLY_ACC=CAM_ASM_000551 /TAXON_ID=420261 /ORGANISM="Thalassiosira antarctica, Strain CCMP982" /LENGTH=251 /DNA_ID=CAMNT_0048416125 /DNA_START=160 /DNA_END=915 /DNA_ORIENTATION=+